MRWIKKLRTAMHDHLTPAAQRLLDAILDLAVLQDGTTNKWAAPKEDVLIALKQSEGQRLDGDAWRQRLQTIRRAINASDALKIKGQPVATIKSEKHAFVIEWAEGARESFERDETRSAVGSSGHADYQINIGALEPIAAELQAPVSHTVFLSHNWEDENVNEILDAFANLLANKLRKLPSRWVDKISVDLIYDRDKGFHSRADFSVQAEDRCNAASFGIWMTSDGWCQSEVCQQEASIFKSKSKIGKQNPYICVQLLGDRKDLPAEYRKLPNLPSSRGGDFGGCKNLLEIWNHPESLKDDFVSAIRDEICEYLEQLPSIDPGQLRLQSIRDHIARRVHFKLDLEKARRVEAHFTLEDGDDHKIASGNRPLAVDRLYSWATDDDEPNRIVFLFGGFGMGKTTTVQALHERLQANWQEPNVPTPIYLDFRRLIPLSDHGKPIAFDMPTLVHTALHSDAQREVTGEQVVELIRSDRSLVIFDGLDEVGNRIGREAAAQLYRKFLELIPADVLSEEAKAGRADWTKCQTRLILTCRTHFFRDLREQTNLLSGSSRMAPRLEKGNGDPQVPGASTFYMAPFRMEQIAELFKNALGEDLGGETISIIRRIHDLSGLASRPIMARFISEVAGELVERHKQGDPINIATIYEELFLHGLERDAEKRPLLTVQDRTDVLKALALHLQSNGLGPQTADELERWFDAFAHAHNGVLLVLRSGAINARDILHTELENASFLVRGSDDRFRFAHTSYQEYFLALAIAECDDIDALERIVSHPISAETRDFVHAIGTRHRREPVLVRRWLDILRSNRAMLLRRFALDMLSNGVRTYKMPAGANLSGMDLRGIRALRKFDWTNVNLGKAQLNHLDARNGQFRDCDFQDAVLANARFENVEFESCEGMPIGLESARGVGTALPEKWKHETKITGRFWRESTNYRGELITLGSDVSSVRTSPDGTRIVTASSDKTARLWDAETGRMLQVLEGHGGWVLSAEFSPDGTRIVTASHDRTARLWDAETGRLLHALEGHGDGVLSAEFSPDGTRIVTASRDKTARLWDAETGRLLHTLEGHGILVLSAEFSPDGTRIVTASRDKTARLWDAETGRLLHALEGHGDMVLSAEFSPDGTRIVTASHDRTARLWDAETGRLLHTLEGHGILVLSAEFSPDGTRIVTASRDKTARLWDAETGRLLHVLEGHGDGVQSAEFSPDGTRIVTASDDETARLWDAETGRLLHALEGHGDEVQSAEFSPDGTRIVTASRDETARLWDAETGRLLHSLEGYGDGVQSAEFSPDGTRIVTASDDETARLWDAETGRLLHVLEGHGDGVQSAEFSPDGTRIVTASFDETARLWDAETGRLLHVLEGHGGWVLSAEFSPDGTRIATASHGRTARLWDAETGRLLHVLEGHGGWVLSAEFSPDGTHIVTASSDRTARLWDAETGRLLHALEGHEGWVQSAEFSPDGTRIVTASDDETARLWDAETGRLLHSLEGHGNMVLSAEFSPDGTRIVTASFDETARLWDAETGRLLHALEGHGDGVLSAEFSPDGTRIVTASRDETARLWDAETGRLLHALEAHGGWVLSAEFSPDGTRIVTASRDKTARLWGAEPASAHLALIGLPESWCATLPDGKIASHGQSFWRYVA